MQKAVFFDRDGVINKDYGYVGSIERFEFLPGVISALAKIKQQGYLTILVTNQSGIGRGMYSINDFFKVRDYMQQTLQESSAAFDAVYFCPHLPKAIVSEFRCDCTCRKPKPGMLLWAKEEFDIDMENSIMIGDHASDMEAALSAKVGTVILVGEHLETEKDLVPQAKCFKDLPDFVDNFLLA